MMAPTRWRPAKQIDAVYLAALIVLGIVLVIAMIWMER